MDNVEIVESEPEGLEAQYVTGLMDAANYLSTPIDLLKPSDLGKLRYVVNQIGAGNKADLLVELSESERRGGALKLDETRIDKLYKRYRLKEQIRSLTRELNA